MTKNDLKWLMRLYKDRDARMIDVIALLKLVVEMGEKFNGQ